MTMCSGVFFFGAFAFLTLIPKYECFHPELNKWIPCYEKDFCFKTGNEVEWRVDWENDASLHNLVV